MPPAPFVRLPWVDHLRTFVIVLVVNLHACVSYSHVGDWYFMSEREPTLAAKVPFIVWEGHLQSFFMGLLFLISGYFAYVSLARRGPWRFMRERLLRLGLPALFYMLVIHPFILLILNPWNAKLSAPTEVEGGRTDPDHGG
jgi:glucan biosynthesis protein C